VLDHWENFTAFTNVKQFDMFLGLSTEEMKKVCELIIRLRKVNLKEAMTWKPKTPSD
jgi:hypothetical protein